MTVEVEPAAGKFEKYSSPAKETELFYTYFTENTHTLTP